MGLVFAIFLVRFGWFGFYSLRGGSLAGFRKTSSPVSAYIVRATGSTRNSSRTACRDDPTSQSTYKAFCAAMMPMSNRGVFSLLTMNQATKC